MPRTKNFRVLREQVMARPGAAERVERLKQEALAEMGLDELRRLLDLSQHDVAERLDVGQPTISKLEHANDLRLSTIRNYVTALGGTLELRVHLPDRDVALTIGDSEQESA